MMADNGDFQAFMARYFPIFLLGFFTSLLAVALAVTLWVDGHWRGHPDNALYSVGACGGLVLLLCIGHFVMIRGLRWATWVVLAGPVVALLMALSLIGSGQDRVLLAVMLGLPLLALLVFNTDRHREMRQRLVALRQARR